MVWAAVPGRAEHDGLPSIRFVEPSEVGTYLEQACSAGRLPVVVPPPGPGQRGRLALVIEGAVEEVLARRGGSPPGVGASSDLDASLSDQLYRARLVGFSGLALGFPSLEGIANLAGSLDAEDSAVLRWWITAAHERPIALFLAARDRFLGVYGPPTSLSSVVRCRGAGPTASDPAHSVPNAAPEVAASVAAMELSAVPPDVSAPSQAEPQQGSWDGPDSEGDLDVTLALAQLATCDDPAVSAPLPGDGCGAEGDESPAAPDPQPLADTAEPLGPRPSSPIGAAMAALFADAPLPESAADATEEPAPRGAAPVPTPAEQPSDDRPQEGSFERLLDDLLQHTPPAPTRRRPRGQAVERVEARPDPSPQLELLVAPIESPHLAPEPTPPPSAVPAAAQPVAPLAPSAATDWRTWVSELDAARGPKPLGVVERMFVSAYTPLRDAVALGIAGEEANEVLDGWAMSFEKSYTDAFDALRLRGKRPTMVLDAPDIAQRLARLHGARTVQLIVVDGMRFDVGQRMHEYLRPQVDQRAALTERLLLWAALPTTTATQLDLVGRGPEALRDGGRGPDSQLPVARGRSATLLRRIRAGQRDVMKLDLVEARVQERGPLTPAVLDGLAQEVATVLASHFDRLRERTLAMVFGDHGFVIDDGEGPARHGGARPEEVLVPAYAWLVGHVH